MTQVRSRLSAVLVGAALVAAPILTAIALFPTVGGSILFVAPLMVRGLLLVGWRYDLGARRHRTDPLPEGRQLPERAFDW